MVSTPEGINENSRTDVEMLVTLNKSSARNLLSQLFALLYVKQKMMYIEWDLLK